MKILLLDHTPLQYEPPVFALGRALASGGHKVVCVGYWEEGLPHSQEVCPDFLLVRVKRGSWAFLPGFLRRGCRFARYGLGVLACVWRFRPFLLVPMGCEVLPLAFVLRGRGRKVVYYATEFTPRPTVRAFMEGWGFVQACEPWCARRADLRVSVEPNRAALQGREWGTRVDLIIANAPRFEPSIQELAMRSIQQAGGPLKFVFAGTIGRRNVLHLVCSAITNVEDSTLTICGRILDGYPEEFRNIVTSYQEKSGGRIRYIGEVPYEYLPEVLSGFDVGLSIYSGLETNVRFAAPAKIFEYLRAGLAVLSTDQALPKSILGQSNAGRLVEANRLESLEPVIHGMVRDKAAVRRLRYHGLHAFRERYCHQIQVAPLLSWIGSCTTTSAPVASKSALSRALR